MTNIIPKARQAAWRILNVLERDPNRPLPVLLDQANQEFRLDARDTALCMELAYGVLRMRCPLQNIVRPRLRKPNAMPRPIHNLLLMGAYEIICLEHIPARATVCEAVNLVRKKYGPGMGGLVNAVLRGIDRDFAELQKSSQIAAQKPAHLTADHIAFRGSLPDWLAKAWLTEFGETAWRLATASTEKPGLACRLNAARPSWQKTRAQLLEEGAQPIGETGLCFTGTDFVDNDLLGSAQELSFPMLGDSGHNGQGSAQETAWRGRLRALETEGDLTRQGAGAILAAEAVIKCIKQEPNWQSKTVWDACCGRGGKTTALLEQDVNVILASDPNAWRLTALKDSLERLNLPHPRIVNAPLDKAAPDKQRFDWIILDVPCTGSGTLARNPELRLRLSPERLTEAVALQAELLKTAWGRLKPGGKLIYLTCSLLPQENRMQVEAFLASHLSHSAVRHQVQEAQELFLPVWPGQDAMFMAVIAAVQ